MQKYLTVVFLFVVSGMQLWAGGPWPQPMGKGYFKLSQFWVVFDKHYTDRGLTDPNVTTGIFNTNFYGEFGVTPRITGMVNANLIARTYVNDIVSGTTGQLLIQGNEATTIGDMNVGAKYAITKPGSIVPISATLMLGIPSGKDFIENAADPQTGILQTGDGEFNQLLRVDAGFGFNLIPAINAYVSAYAGVNNRTNEFSDEFHVGGEAGASILNDRLWFIFRLNSVTSFENGEINQENINTSIFSNNTEFVSPGFEVSLFVTRKLGVSVSYAGASSGRLIAAAPMYSVGVFYDMNR